MSHARSRIAVAALGVLALAGCAVPGQDASAGTASEYQGTTVTNAQVDATFAAWVQGTNGALVASRSEVMTMELLHDDLLAACEEIGTPIHTSEAEMTAQQWFTSLGVATAPSADFVHSFESQLALAVLVLTGHKDLLDGIITDAAAHAKVSPRAGQIDVDGFRASVDAAAAASTKQDPFGQFQHVNAFSSAHTSWIDRG